MSAESGSYISICVQSGPRKLSIIRSSGVSGLSELFVSVKRGSTVVSFHSLEGVEG